jgi:NADPH:quinone reductase-like Zn-dependent oxidoreductase
MKASVIHQYGGPDVLKYEDYADPALAEGQVLVRVAATSINPVDLGRRSGRMKEIFPIRFPGIIGLDVAGTIVKLGPGVTGLAAGEKVLAYADQAYAELCAIAAANVAKVPAGLDVVDAAALPVVATTAHQLIVGGAALKAGQTILVSGAVGSVGRAAVYVAKSLGAVVMAAVLNRQLKQAATLGADRVIATDDPDAMAQLPGLDAVADTVGGKTATILLGKVTPGGVYASVVGPPANAKDYPSVRIAPVYSRPDAKALSEMARAAADGKLVIPIGRKLPLSSASEGHALMEKGGIGKVLLLP